MQDAIDNVKQTRAVFGDQVDLLIELHCRLTLAETITFSIGIKDTHTMIVEDPIRSESASAIAEAHHVQVVPQHATEFEADVFESTMKHIGRDVVDYVPLPKYGFVDAPSLVPD
ncbi:hypothetical protein F5Y09DRAFT_343112 [Xylaria sp. FL1042]|nr:hypothetical protein F5Y09DRAFT_343112 [Xylaria sp. FL1042]